MMSFKMRNKSKWMIIAAGVIVIGLIVMFSKAGGVSAEVLKLSKGEIKQYIEESAQVLPREKQTVFIEGSGKIVNINVDVGDRVKKGDLLLSLDKADLELQLKDAEAKVEASKAQLKGTELVNYANKIELAKASVDQAQAAYYSAQRNFYHAKELLEANAMSKSEFDKANDAYKTATAALNSANLQLEDIKQGAPDYVKSGYQAQLEQAVVHRDTILKSIQRQEVRAAIDGVIIERSVENNSIAAPSTPAFVIGNVESLELEADILADDVNKVKAGNEVEISGKPIGDKVLKGKVTKIAPSAKTIASALGVNQKRVPVTIEIVEPTDLLKPGYNMDIKIITASKNDIIAVPDSSVFEYKGKNDVFVVINGKAVLREVKKGIENGNFIEMQEGLKPGEIILVKPDNNIKEGMKIKQSDKKQ